jgi:hypothetical protein
MKALAWAAGGAAAGFVVGVCLAMAVGGPWHVVRVNDSYVVKVNSWTGETWWNGAGSSGWRGWKKVE